MTTMNMCACCEKPYVSEETETFIYSLNLPLSAAKVAEEHGDSLCIYCLRDQITRDTGIMFVTCYEVVLQEKIMIWEDENNA